MICLVFLAGFSTFVNQKSESSGLTGRDFDRGRRPKWTGFLRHRLEQPRRLPGRGSSYLAQAKPEEGLISGRKSQRRRMLLLLSVFFLFPGFSIEVPSLVFAKTWRFLI